MILRTHTSESPRRVTGRSHHHDLVIESIRPRTHGKRLTFLERPGFHHGIPSRPIAIKRDVNIQTAPRSCKSREHRNLPASGK